MHPTQCTIAISMRGYKMKYILALLLTLVAAEATAKPGSLVPEYEPLKPTGEYKLGKPPVKSEPYRDWRLECYETGEVLENGQPEIVCDIIYTPRWPYT
jgi:hypothetical protein